ncbi:hypothetical protein [Helicobacter zhangjianzhongii]|uniref:Sua5/YciO/YrdC/YwlC family protein n=1 Tax=Helicobacter zhangjianzhongii TaxID=2974574 RepID=A0ACC6FQ80_9HELI|nr:MULTISPECIES: hypothetical protein [unclassified Helicobacter]MDL0079200.1 Sua5/YciO/YrdC/YwlC family protein [Helicobacter sp. CPD2-1]MDL0081227.1 Sua5/YciO/YrdC/YwlC family protein [Helicobacter sp. XJK30-2]
MTSISRKHCKTSFNKKPKEPLAEYVALLCERYALLAFRPKGASFVVLSKNEKHKQILESTFDKPAENKKVDSSDEAFSSSLRADLSAWQSIQTKTHTLESTFDKNAQKIQSIASLAKVDSSDTPIFATAKTIDCHATATQRLAMTEKNAKTHKAKLSKQPPIFLAQTDTTAGFLCSSPTLLNRAKLRPSSQAVLKTFASLQCATQELRVPISHRHFVRRASKTSVILPSKKSFRIVKEPLHREFLRYFGGLCSTSANRTKEPFSLEFALQVADVVIVDSRGLYEDKPSAIYRLSRTRKRRAR